MADRKRGARAFVLFITILVILLMLAIALFVYGSMTNSLTQPSLPRRGLFALGMITRHG